MSTTFRDACASDLPAIDCIFRTSFCDTFAHLYRAEDLDAFLAKFTPEAWRDEFDDRAYAFRIAQVDGQAVGFVKLGPLTVPVEPPGNALELRQLYIVRDHLGSGIGKQLMDWALNEARRRNVAELYLTVYKDNHRARRLYERYDFESVGRYDFMVGNHADEDIIMRKQL